MSLQAKLYYYVICDACGRRAEYNDDITAWEKQDTAYDETIAIEWTELDGRWHCHACPPLDVEEPEIAARTADAAPQGRL